jgi:hypothetical protein
MKQAHKDFETKLNICFETNRPSKYDQGIKLLSNFDDEVIIKNDKYVTLNKDGKPVKSINTRTLIDDEKAYMP